ncbi:adenylate/guanylate cyclase domain-containing protein [Mesorhizobium delmotii]|uniref:Adenylate cyclase n=1 Tax=Mesorhizobium delmotii TaxID=1631247 RepID=A0A2P9AKS7_9HYPH|nr:adenylate/guanylate cyclase domain-containing protein [Mesorhizobium delmotii]SJM31761.1 Adenylate cyclase [Mesorhizobium delmotii]
MLPNIRLGTERYPEKVARRLRGLNIVTWIASATHAFYVVALLPDFTRFWWLATGNAVAMLLYAGIPLLHRFGRLAGPVAVTVIFYADVSAYVWLLGTSIGIQFYFLIGVGLALLYVGPEYVALAAVSGAVAAFLITVLQLMVPYDTGLLPEWLFIASFVTNAFVSCGTLLLIVYYALREAARAEAAAEREYERSERLLTNILPSPIAARLKSESNVVIADRYDEASVLFADMAGFTALASETAPDDLVQFLNRVFSDFDRLVERHGLEKIKTTGDAYMVVSGVPMARPDHAEALAVLALEMCKAATEWRDARGRNVPVRIGIGGGPVVAGVVGTRKFFYDVWGDAVNVAARMETTGSAGKIQVSEDIYERLKEGFELEARGEIEVKGKGRMLTWFLLARKPPA